MTTRPAVLFDIDGTLLDTNYFHTVSWWQALQEAGEDIAMARIHPLIGMGSDQLLQDLLGEEREGLSDVHAKPGSTDWRWLMAHCSRRAGQLRS
jgi:phosphoglycolate phosphatase-like HAD superfamily hydrolase